MKKQLTLTLMMLLVAASSSAVEVEIGGLWYEVVSETKEAKVILYRNGNMYRGDIVIPAAVKYNGDNYGVTSIGNRAFSGCSGLTSVAIPNSVTSIGNGVFYGCSGLTSIAVEDGNTIYDSRDNCNAIIETSTNKLLFGCQSTQIPISVTSIGNYAFRDCSGLTSITIPNSVTSIGGNAFSGCYALASVTLHCSSIDSWFSGMTSIKDIIIGNGVKCIGSSAFSYCSGLTTVTIGNGVTSIGDAAFYGCTDLNSVTIPNSVTSIDERAFYNCSGLTSITIPGSVTSIGEYAFEGCSGLTAVHITDMAAWCGISFGLRYANPLYYAHRLFLNGTEIKDLVVPNSVTSIGDYSFYGCSSLTSVTIPNSITSIGGNAFRDCSGLTSITIPNSVTSIGVYACYNCSGLTSVTIPSSVTLIGYDAFGGCNNLLTVNSEITEPFNCKDAFSNETFRKGTLYVPAGTKDLYARFDGWREFLNIEEVGGEAEQSVWLSIKDAQGTTKIKLKKGTKQELVISPEEGWKILSVAMDGTDVTAQATNGGSFTTPAINSDASIIIVYEQEVPSGVRTAHSQADVKVVSDGVVISNAEPETRCIIYSTDGQQVVNTVISEGTRKISLQQGQVYILTIDGRTLKFAL